MTPEDSVIIQSEINNIYQKFVQKAADGRGMSFEALEKVASGRVWSGAMALENGLVDIHGGLDSAIEIAANAAQLDNYEIIYFPKLSPLTGDVVSGYKEVATPEEFKYLKNSALYKYAQDLVKLEKMEGVQARSPYELIIK